MRISKSSRVIKKEGALRVVCTGLRWEESFPKGGIGAVLAAVVVWVVLISDQVNQVCKSLICKHFYFVVRLVGWDRHSVPSVLGTTEGGGGGSASAQVSIFTDGFVRTPIAGKWLPSPPIPFQSPFSKNKNRALHQRLKTYA